jgi:hypothetical protein
MITENEVDKNCFLLVPNTIIIQSQHATFQAQDEQADFRPSSPGVAAACSFSTTFLLQYQGPSCRSRQATSPFFFNIIIASIL